MELSTRVSGISKVQGQEKVLKSGKMALNMKVTGKMTEQMDTVDLSIETGVSL